MSKAETLKKHLIIEIELALPKGDETPREERIMRFRRVSGFDFAKAGLLPLDLFRDAAMRKRITPEEAKKRTERHIKMFFENEKALENYERAVERILIEASVAPKIVEDGQVEDGSDAIPVGLLGPLKDILLNELSIKCGLHEEVERLAPFRHGASGSGHRRSSKKVRHPAERTSKR